MTPQHGPMWDLYEGEELAAYVRRSETGGWVVTLKALYPDKIHVEDGTNPVNFANLMLSMHTKDKS